MKSINKMSDWPLEELSKNIMCATEVKPHNDGFVATFQLRRCYGVPQFSVNENQKLRWYSPSRCILSCSRGNGNRYGSARIANAISKGLGDYTAILGKAEVSLEDGEHGKAGDIWFESTDPREAIHILLLPVAASEWTSNSWEEAEVQRHSLMYAVNDDTQWGSKRYILLEIGYRYTAKGETWDYEAQANLVRKLATAELMLTGHCPEDLANEFFPGLIRDRIMDGCLLTRAFGERTTSNVARACYVIDTDGEKILPTMYRNCDNGNGVQELLWLNIPDDALVVYCDYDRADGKFEVTPIQGKMNSATKKQRSTVVNIVNGWLTEE